MKNGNGISSEDNWGSTFVDDEGIDAVFSQFISARSPQGSRSNSENNLLTPLQAALKAQVPPDNEAGSGFDDYVTVEIPILDVSAATPAPANNFLTTTILSRGQAAIANAVPHIAAAVLNAGVAGTSIAIDGWQAARLVFTATLKAAHTLRDRNTRSEL